MSCAIPERENCAERALQAVFDRQVDARLAAVILRLKKDR